MKARSAREPGRLGYAATMQAPSASDSYFYLPEYGFGIANHLLSEANHVAY
jgi:hypothetical protein